MCEGRGAYQGSFTGQQTAEVVRGCGWQLGTEAKPTSPWVPTKPGRAGVLPGHLQRPQGASAAPKSQTTSGGPPNSL